MKMFQSSSAAIWWLALIGLAGCGHEPSDSHSLNVRDEADARYLARFTPEQAMALEDRNFVSKVFGRGSSETPPEPLLRELGSYTVASQSQVYVSSSLSLDELKRRIIVLNEKVSGMTNIVDTRGRSLYESAISVDVSGFPIPEQSDGLAPDSGENHYVSIVAREGNNNVTGILKSTIADDQNLVRLDMANHTELKAKILGLTVVAINPGNFVSRSELYPYKSGYLIYSWTKLQAANSLVALQLTTANLAEKQKATLDYLLKGIFAD